MSQLEENEAGQAVLKAMVRATDQNGQVQSGEPEEMYNLRGLLNTSKHTIDIILT